MKLRRGIAYVSRSRPGKIFWMFLCALLILAAFRLSVRAFGAPPARRLHLLPTTFSGTTWQNVPGAFVQNVSEDGIFQNFTAETSAASHIGIAAVPSSVPTEPSSASE